MSFSGLSRWTFPAKRRMAVLSISSRFSLKNTIRNLAYLLYFPMS